MHNGTPIGRKTSVAREDAVSECREAGEKYPHHGCILLISRSISHGGKRSVPLLLIIAALGQINTESITQYCTLDSTESG